MSMKSQREGCYGMRSYMKSAQGQRRLGRLLLGGRLIGTGKRGGSKGREVGRGDIYMERSGSIIPLGFLSLLC